MSKKTINQNRQNFLLSFFKEDCYQEREINGFYLTKSINGNTGKWIVSIYTKESFKRYKDASANYSRLNYLLEEELDKP